MILYLPRSTLFPYTTLFRSLDQDLHRARRRQWSDHSYGCHRRRIQVLKLRNRLGRKRARDRSEEHTSELQSRQYIVCRLLLEKKKKKVGLIDIIITKITK